MAGKNEVDQELRALEHGLVVSCQAREDNPLHGPEFMAAMAEAARLGGAVGIRANGAADVAAIRARVDLPILGINKVKVSDGSVFITPSCATAIEVIEAGAGLVAIDGTARPRPGGESLGDVIRCIHEHGAAALADISTLEEGLEAAALGADCVGTTLSGYTPYSPKQDAPDFELLRRLVQECRVPVFAEGRIWTIEQAAEALAIGAAFVVVGTAITNPMAITARYVKALRTAAATGVTPTR